MNTIAILKDALVVYRKFPAPQNDVRISHTEMLMYMLDLHDSIHNRILYDTEHCFKEIPIQLFISAIDVLEHANYDWTETYKVLKEHVYGPVCNHALS